ncbi:hypothetical protein ABMA77_08780 [Halobacteriovorax sp. RZ-1]|uniref:hypothetical protein n=1 Tax=unclassified Halobacteriovorax TaxID=2639665 RepID=UPI003720C800
MKELRYRGYSGICDFSEEDNVYFGKIDLEYDLVSFESDTLEGLKPAFEEAVDDYLDMCKSLNKKPG